jgi:uncharacterized protein YjbI with pentapeptide repeats
LPGHPPKLSRAKLSGADLSEANLSHANLIGAKLSRANLSGADLYEADLSQADLSEANLSHANLSGALLSQADLSETNLSHANLSGAFISRANLSHANLSHANLSGTILSHAELFYTTIVDVDLSLASGLESVDHRGPSSIGIDTLVLSKGNIPPAFLRGCGLQDWLIEAAPLFQENLTTAEVNDILYRVFPLRSGQAFQFYSCFISYSHADKPFARRLYDTLQGRGIRCWLDQRQLLPGDPLYEHIDPGYSAVGQVPVVLL